MRQNFNNKEGKIQSAIIIAIVCTSVFVIGLITALIFNSDGKTLAEGTTEISSENDEQYMTDNYESASSEIGKTVQESEEEYENANLIENPKNTVSSITENENEIENVGSEEKEDSQETSSKVEETNQTTEDESEEAETLETKITFKMPISGEILREFASDSLVYSETLQEWITHNGIDIKADKTSVVAATADGKVQSIKNDPRYGLTVIVNHDNGYQSVYSNLLTAEFVVEGEEIKQGQTIGTIGNSASFEICDDYHLHFELLKDGKYLDPNIYIEQ